jgi:hypothetical protein
MTSKPEDLIDRRPGRAMRRIPGTVCARARTHNAFASIVDVDVDADLVRSGSGAFVGAVLTALVPQYAASADVVPHHVVSADAIPRHATSADAVLV